MSDAQFVVVQNHEGQFSIWPCERDVPAGWDVQPQRGSKEECLKYISEVWTDMTPLSLRKEQ